MNCFQMDFGTEPAAGAPSACLCCPFCAGSRDMRMDYRAVKHMHQMCGPAQSGQHLEVIPKHASLAGPVKAFSDAIPLAVSLW